MKKEVQSSTHDGAICELSVLADRTNEQSTKIKRKIRIFNHPKNLIEVLCARLAIEKGISGNAITTGPNQYRFTRTFLDGEALSIFDLKSTELCQETVSNLKIVINHVVTYFGPKECLSKQKRYLRYKMTKSRKLTTRQYVGLVRESELVDSLANKAPRTHKAMLISQGFNPESAGLETFVEYCERAETTDDIAGANVAASDENSEPRKIKRVKSKDEHGKKCQKRSTKLYCSPHGENTSHTSRECNVLNSKGKEKPKFSKKDFKKKSREVNLLEKQASQQKAKYLKYKNLNKAFSKKKTPVILEDSESDSSSSSEEENSSYEGEENSITYDSESRGSDKSSNNATDTEEED